MILRCHKVETSREYVDIEIWRPGKGPELELSRRWRVLDWSRAGVGIRLWREHLKVIIFDGPCSECQEG